MQTDNYSFFMAIGIIGVVVLLVAAVSYLAPASREERKRRRNHGRVVSRARRPIVMLSVNTKKA